MSQTIRNGQTIRVNIQTGEKLTAVAVTGTYSITVLAGTGTGTSLATNATGGTYGPYAYSLVVQIVASAESEIDYDAGVTTEIESDTVAKIAVDPLTGQIELTAGGGRIGIANNKAATTQRDVDIFDLKLRGQRRLCSIPSPYYPLLSNEVVHPSVVFCLGGWRGYAYWMAITPYPSSDSIYENPCLYVSQDGETWEAAPGVVNPLVATPGGGNYNADTHLYLMPDASMLVLAFRERGVAGKNNLKIMTSQNGHDWSAPVTVASGNVGSQDFGSPNIWFDGTKFVAITHNLDVGGFPVQMLTNDSADPTTGWGAPTTITMTHPTAGTWWHSGLTRLPSGNIIGVVQDGNSGGGDLYWVESLDAGLTFAARRLTTDGGYYRSNITLMKTQAGELEGLVLYVGRVSGGWYVHREEWVFGAADTQIERGYNEILRLGTGSAKQALVYDSFDRADGAYTSPLVGPAPVVDAGSFTIASNKLSSGSVGNNRALFNTGVTSYTLEITLSNLWSAGQWVIVRAQDTTNFFRFGNDGSNQLTAQRIVGGSVAGLNATLLRPGSTQVTTMAAGDRIRIAVSPTGITVSCNGSVYARIKDAMFNTATKCGLQATNAGGLFDNLIVCKT